MDVCDRKGRRFAGLALLWLLCLLVAPAGLGQQETCLYCLRVEPERRVLGPGEAPRVRLDVEAADLPVQVADAYLGVLMPDGSSEILEQALGWRVRDLRGFPLELPPLASTQTGPASLYFVLTHPGSDPRQTGNWISAALANVALMEEPWRRAEDASLPSNAGFPQLIAHAGGAVDGIPVSNSLQALDSNYNAGQRYFEVDISWTSDSRLVLIHDWGATYQRLFSRRDGPPTLEEFLSLPMNHGLSQLDLAGLLEWMRAHPDAWIVTDVKSRNADALRRIASEAGSLLHRFVPQVSSEADYQAVLDGGFANVVFTLYASGMDNREVLDFLDKHPVTAVVLPWERALFQPLALRLRQRGIFLYAHTVNSLLLRNVLRARGVRGIYSDTLQPAPQ